MEYKEIINKEDLRDIFIDTVKEIATTVTATMGPHGNTVILADSYNPPYVTKDGVSVIKAIAFSDPVKNTIAKMLKEVAINTVEKAGDGTTTAICLAYAIIKEGFNQLRRGKQYLELLDELNLFEKYVILHLEEMTEDLQKENIADVATISANGDKHMGIIIQEAFNHTGNVKVEIGVSSEDEIDKVNGMILDTGYLDPSLVNIEDKDTVEYKNPHFIILDGKLDNMKQVSSQLHSINGPIIIIADDVNTNVLTILRDNYNRGALEVGLMKSPGFGGHRKNLIKDLKIFTNVEGSPNLYKADYISIGRDETLITKNKTTAVCKKHISNLKKIKKQRKDERSKELIDKRISYLTGALSVIKVGGISTVEVKEKFDRYDDAVRAVGCALEEGIVPGGGQALHLIKNRLKESDIGKSDILDILDAPMMQIEENANYTLDIALNDMLKKKVFDPTKVTKTAFINAMSVAKVILNTSNIVLDKSLWI